MSGQQVHIYYSGSVQGVGFRFTARDIACKLGVKGWVKNLSDGRVELFAQGPQPCLKQYLDQISDNFSGYITDQQEHWNNASVSLPDFKIMH
ncbi:MAG: acylphosphatase [Candidatus Omnitrophica bacterium]|jgi:acylphosphatase|nr:acylphosphatase [Candidatus Omnitrophota bacterium]